MINVMIADDHPVVRQGLGRIFADAGDISVVAEAEDGTQAIEKALHNPVPVQVVLLDVSMPGKNWLDVIEQIKRPRPDIAVLVLSRHAEEEYALRSLKAGASGYLNKGALLEELLSAIRRVASGRRYISDALAEKLASAALSTSVELGPPHQALTPQEYKVMHLLAQGKAITDIARELNLSHSTVSTYRARILIKMNLGSDAEIVRYALEHEMID